MSKYASHEQTLVLIKPDAVQRALVGEVIRRLERIGLRLMGLKMVWITEEKASQHYSDNLAKYGDKIFKRTINMITEAPLIAAVFEGHHAVEVVRKHVGSTFPKDSLPGTIRGDFAHVSKNPFNLIHASANKEEAEAEIKLWFEKGELHSYSRNDEKHVLSPTDED